MSAFLNALKGDLLERRLRAVLVLLTAALIGALAYALSGGGGSATAPPASSPSVVPRVSGIAPVAVAPSADQAVAETTSGSAKQRGGATRDPFAPLPGSVATSASASSTSSSGASSKSSGSSAASTKSEAKSSKPSSKSPAPAKPVHVVIHFLVTAQFGVVPPAPTPGAPPPPAQLKTYKDMKLTEALPSKKDAQLIYLGVVLHTGKDAVFELTGEAVLHGSAKCLPSAAQCRAIELKPGQSETVGSLEANGTPVTYELKLLSIARSVTSGSSGRAHVASG